MAKASAQRGGNHSALANQNWSDLSREAKVKAIKPMLAEGKSGQQIGDTLSCSRQAVIGFCYRNGLQLGQSGKPKSTKRVRRGKPSLPKIGTGKAACIAEEPLQAADARPIILEAKPEPQAAVAEEAAGSSVVADQRRPAVPSGLAEGVRFLDVEAGQCRWPLWCGLRGSTDIRDKFVCGATTGEGAVYCTHHAGIGGAGYTAREDSLAKRGRFRGAGQAMSLTEVSARSGGWR